MGLKSGSKSGKGVKQGSSKVGLNKIQSSGKNVKLEEKEIDTSVLRPSIEISVAGVPQLVQAYQAATEELKTILARECDLIYECRVCRNLFRSLANMIAHKRVYCKTTYSYGKHCLNRNYMLEDYTVVVQPEPVPTLSHDKQNWTTSDKVYDGFSTDGNVKSQIVPTSSRILPVKNPKRGLKEIVEKLTSSSCNVASTQMDNKYTSATQLYDQVKESVIARSNDRLEHSYHLEDIDTSKVGKFQTKLASGSKNIEKEDLMKTQVSELHNMASQSEALLGPDGLTVPLNRHSPLSAQNNTSGKIPDCQNESKSGHDVHVCSYCNVRFSTRKTLNHHMKSLHVTFRLCYPCPCCKSTFVNPWSVYRHLYKVHRKTTAQVKRLRPQIQKKAFRKEFHNEAPAVEKNAKRDAIKESERLDQENQAWMDNFEDDLELQRCGGCGRRFERRAALNSHSQICQKRIAARNNIKSVRNLPSSSSPDKICKPSLTEENGVNGDANKKSTNANKITNSLHDITSSFGLAKMQPNPNNTWVEQQKKEVREKKIEIQIRKDYCKMSSSSSVVALSNDTQSEPSSRPPSCIVEDEESFENEKNWDSVMEIEETTHEDSDSEDLSQNSQHLDIFVNGDVDEKEEKMVHNVPSRRNSELALNTKPLSENVTQEFSIKEDDLSADETVECTRKRTISVNDDSKQICESKRTRQSCGTESNLFSEKSSLNLSKNKKVEQYYPIMEARMKKLINLRRLQCLPCQKKFIKLTNLRRHVAVHIGWCRYRCVLCTFKCFSKYDCVDHVCKVHLKDSQRNKADSMVEYIEEQEAKVVSDVCEIEDLKDDGDHHSHSEETTEPLSIEVNSLNLEDIKNIVGVINYNSEDKNNSDSHSVNTSLDHLSHDTNNENEIISHHISCDDNEKEEQTFNKDADIQLSCEKSGLKEVSSDELIEEQNDPLTKSESFSEDSSDCTTETEEKSFDSSINSVLEVSENTKCTVEGNEHEKNKEIELTCSKEERIAVEDQGTGLNGTVSKLCIGSSEIKLDSQLEPPYLMYDDQRSESSQLTTDETSCKSHNFCEKSSEISSGLKNINICSEVGLKMKVDPDMKTTDTKDDVDKETCDKNHSFKEKSCSENYKADDESTDGPADRDYSQNALRKMVMEVIFGSGVHPDTDLVSTQNLFSISLNGNATESDISDDRISTDSCSSDPEVVYDSNNHLSTVVSEDSKTKLDLDQSNALECERRERPVRNRIKVSKEDFIYNYTDSFVKKEESSKIIKKKQIDMGKESAKNDSSLPNQNRSVPKLLLVRTENSENASHHTGAAAGTWNSVYSPSSDFITNKTSVASSSQMYSSSRKVPRTHDVKP